MKNGFTLIELVIYVALLSILATGAVMFLSNIALVSKESAYKIHLQNEADFIILKIDWVLSHLESINAPPSGGSSDQLAGTLDNGTSFSLFIDQSDLFLKVGNTTSILSPDTIVEHLVVERRPDSFSVNIEINGTHYSLIRSF